MSFRTKRINHQQIINNLKSQQPYQPQNYGTNFNYSTSGYNNSDAILNSSTYLLKEEVKEYNVVNNGLNTEVNSGLNSGLNSLSNVNKRLSIYNGSRIEFSECRENILVFPFDASEYDLHEILLVSNSPRDFVLYVKDKDDNMLRENTIKSNGNTNVITKLDKFANTSKELNMLSLSVKFVCTREVKREVKREVTEGTDEGTDEVTNDVTEEGTNEGTYEGMKKITDEIMTSLLTKSVLNSSILSVNVILN